MNNQEMIAKASESVYALTTLKVSYLVHELNKFERLELFKDNAQIVDYLCDLQTEILLALEKFQKRLPEQK